MDLKKIKNKLKQYKYQHLKKLYIKNLSRIPTNCKYNKEVRLPNRSRLNLCSFNLDDSYDVDLCYRPEHAKDCNAFCSRKSKEELTIDFIVDLKDPQIRATKYKDINTLYWVYPDIEFDDFPEKKRWYSWILTFFK